jgi:SAM-dependent methyltransferase
MDTWLHALEQRHLTDLTPSEVARALRALSSCYVERRSKLESGGALDSAGKRAAFALFYGPLHFLTIQRILAGLDPAPVEDIVDIGCGTGVAGAAWALRNGGARVTGVDRHPWAVEEANRTYRDLGVNGRAFQQDAARLKLSSRKSGGIIAAYTINEVPDDVRSALLPKLIDAAEAGARVVIVEPIARRMSGWWDDWARAFREAGGRDDEWRFREELPARQRQLAKAAGLDPRELTARSLTVGSDRGRTIARARSQV